MQLCIFNFSWTFFKILGYYNKLKSRASGSVYAGFLNKADELQPDQQSSAQSSVTKCCKKQQQERSVYFISEAFVVHTAGAALREQKRST